MPPTRSKRIPAAASVAGPVHLRDGDNVHFGRPADTGCPVPVRRESSLRRMRMHRVQRFGSARKLQARWTGPDSGNICGIACGWRYVGALARHGGSKVLSHRRVGVDPECKSRGAPIVVAFALNAVLPLNRWLPLFRRRTFTPFAGFVSRGPAQRTATGAAVE